MLPAGGGDCMIVCMGSQTGVRRKPSDVDFIDLVPKVNGISKCDAGEFIALMDNKCEATYKRPSAVYKSYWSKWIVGVINSGKRDCPWSLPS